MTYRSLTDTSKLILFNLHYIPHDVECVCGANEYGQLIASYVALQLHKPLKRFDEIVKNEKCLIVFDFVDYDTDIESVRKLGGVLFSPYVIVERINDVDIYFERLPTKSCFEWNLFSHEIMEKACFDMDGVLCSDPKMGESDDFDVNKYYGFLENTPPKMLPLKKIGCIVTSRLKKYKNQTEEWLKRHSVEVGEIKMLDCDTIEERFKMYPLGEYKGKIYKEMKEMRLFVESDHETARLINQTSGKAVYCNNTNTMFLAINDKSEK